jgi:hypothetical protein
MDYIPPSLLRITYPTIIIYPHIIPLSLTTTPPVECPPSKHLTSSVYAENVVASQRLVHNKLHSTYTFPPHVGLGSQRLTRAQRDCDVNNTGNTNFRGGRDYEERAMRSCRQQQPGGSRESRTPELERSAHNISHCSYTTRTSDE